MADGGMMSGAAPGLKATYVANLEVAKLMQNAYEDVLRIRRIVENSQNDLETGYKGADGQAFYGLLSSWDADVRQVEQGLLNVKEQMIATSGHQQTKQEEQLEAVQRQQSAFSGLQGPSGR
ncbi:hypothetical protein ACGFYV_34780 [Streptomyces sp. NPDC048297]|uniref:hypothetical protein n=1 Tax=Streptomyces sp. NPDC048297 TaxID=3365531 RepID=UPI003712AE66